MGIGAWSMVALIAVCILAHRLVLWVEREKEVAVAEDVPEQLSMLEAMQHRNEVLAEGTKEVSGPWGQAAREMALELLRTLPHEQEVTGEGIRLQLLERGLRPPETSESWGAFIGGLVKKGVLIKTGRLVPMQVKESHGRGTMVYLVDQEKLAA